MLVVDLGFWPGVWIPDDYFLGHLVNLAHSKSKERTNYIVSEKFHTLVLIPALDR